ncbi:MAG: mechanosensitive ion channel family protein [Tepidiformaceae bacterium]
MDFFYSQESAALGLIGLGLVVTAVLHGIAFRLIRRVGGDGFSAFGESFARHCRSATLVLALALVASVGLGTEELPERLTGPIRHGLALVVIGAVAWTVVRMTAVLEDLLLTRFDIKRTDNLVARKIHTQAVVLQRIVAVVISIVAAAAMLTTFPQVRVMGTSILASAGIAGLVLGLAAQSTLSNLLAGIQIALANPIRIDDVVVVEGEWGRVEEITFTYVVVQVWDERRLILPISYFATRPFENWTRARAEILGSVFLRVDYTVPVDEVRAELQRLVEDSPLWDRRVVSLQVTDSTDRTLVLRALVSASDSSRAWDLRCSVREDLVRFLQRSYPDALPRERAEVFRAERPVSTSL